MSARRTVFIIIVTLLLGAVPSIAQDDEPARPAPNVVEVEAADGWTLSGDYYVPQDETGPAVLLLHQLYTIRTSWQPVIGPLLADGYRVLAVDLRGYGRTRGSINWSQAQEDTLTWVAWLRDQPGVRESAIFIMGSSMGSNLALVGCAQTDCAGAVAISPGRAYFGVYTFDAISTGIPALLVYADRDYRPARDVPQMLELDGANLDMIVYPGRDHGMMLFGAQEDLLPQIIEWLHDHAP